jgi:hypothetical protein
MWYVKYQASKEAKKRLGVFPRMEQKTSPSIGCRARPSKVAGQKSRFQPRLKIDLE